MKDENFFLGLDIGTNSIGWAATNQEYKLLKYCGNKAWGSYIFDEGSPASERRTNRIARRRNDRKKQRILLLNDLFAKEIIKSDPNFFIRMKESALWADDKTLQGKYGLFYDKNYNDKKYFKDYPTIHHLIDELMENKEPHDIRLVYLACKYIVSHRGHFLSPVDESNIEAVTDFKPVYDEFIKWFEDKPWDCEIDEFKKILCTSIGVKSKLKLFTDLLWGGKKPKKNDEDEQTVDIYAVVNLICGGTVELSAVFGVEEYKELEKNKIKLSNSDIIDVVIESLDSNHGELIKLCKNIYDWALLTDVLGNSATISKAKKRIYDEHKKDLKRLKYIIRTYLPEKNYKVFKRADKDLCNYTAYSNNFRSVDDRKNQKNTTQEKFCGYLKKMLSDVKVSAEDEIAYEEMMCKIENNKFCPKQVNSDNRVIPYQLYYYELKVILENACAYLPFLNVEDEYGTVKDKILSIMKFRVPYYVGPLNKSKNKAWIQRKAEGRIYPWNFDDMVDRDLSEQEFIRRMTCRCTYLTEYDVLPKNSLLYSKFTVLNEINNIKINGVGISVEAKQKIYTELFMRKKTVSVSAVKNLLISDGVMKDGDIISGIDNTIKSNLKTYHAFKQLLEKGILSENDVEDIILRITCTEDKQRLKKWLDNNFKLCEADVKHISGLKFKDFGRLSKELLTEILPVDNSTGETTGKNIITAMWETNCNLMQLLSEAYGYKSAIDAANAKYYSENPLKLADRLEELRVSPVVRRTIIRTLDIVKDVSKCIGKAPDKIFIETARELDYSEKKGKRTKSRKQQIIDFYESIEEDVTELKAILENKTDEELRGEKLFLYFMQLGKCMYSGKAIDIDELATKAYDIDHIFPQSVIKDDSIDNKVLVCSELNGKKGDVYPISGEIRQRMYGMWKSYRDNGLISEKKFIRLTRNTGFTDDELADFISRQLVETRQSIKAAAQLLNEYYPNTEIVYVKAGLVSEFRQECDILKCRDINDLHHAKDAYLNIVMGNVYNTKFTKNPVNFIKNRKNEKYSLKLKSLLFDKDKKSCHHIERNGVIAWNGDGSTMHTVMETVKKNAIIYNKYSFVRKGVLFDVTPLKAQENDAMLPRKKNLPVEKYGGYRKLTAAGFALVKYCTDSGRNGAAIICIELIHLNNYINDVEFAENYAKKMLARIVLSKKEKCIEKVEFPMGKRLIKVGTMVEMDGFRAFLMSKTSGGTGIIISSATPLVLSEEYEEYIRKISKYKEKLKTNPNLKLDEKRDGVNAEKNVKLFDEMCRKMSNSKYIVKFSDMYNKISNKRDVFVSLTTAEQALVLLNIVDILKTNRSNTCDLTAINLSKDSAIIGLSTNLSKISDLKTLYIIDKSPSGLIEKKSVNLLEI